MAGLILHHYPRSPFAEKARLAMGLKGLAYGSVTVPSWMPKPDLLPLTGGYRRTPVLQAGADVWCDTALMLPTLERLHPAKPSLYPDGTRTVATVLGAALERALFVPVIGVIVGLTGRTYPRELVEDRLGFFGFSLEHRDMLPQQAMFLDRLNAHLPRLHALLADGRPFLLGDRPGAADLCAYHPLWHLRRAGGVPEAAETVSALLPALRPLLPWMDRVAAIGHGRPEEMTGAAALDAASAADPDGGAEGAEAAPLHGLAPGAVVTVTPDDSGRDPVRGVLVRVGAEEIVLRREDPRVGVVHVHFPRAGFDAARA